MKIALNTTIRPVGFDYARALHSLGALQCVVSAFPRRMSGGFVAEVESKAVFCDTWQLAFLFANRLGGSTPVSRLLSHIAKVRLDACTAAHLAGANAAVFYSGAGLDTVRACRAKGILSASQVHHAHVLIQEKVLKAEAAASGVPYTPIYDPRQVRRQLREFEEVDVILCPSNAVRESFVSAGLPETKLIVVPHGVDLQVEQTLCDRARTPGDHLRVLYVGQLHYRKGLRYFAQALQGYASTEIECRIVGPDFGLSGLASTPGAERFIKTGPKKGRDLLAEYAEADVFVLPSVEEGFGLVVLEAMRAGLPVIITSAVGAKDFVTNGVEGWVVPPADPEALRTRIEWMRTHPAERQAMGRAAARRAQTAGSWTTSAKHLLEVLSQKTEELKQRKN